MPELAADRLATAAAQAAGADRLGAGDGAARRQRHVGPRAGPRAAAARHAGHRAEPARDDRVAAALSGAGVRPAAAARRGAGTMRRRWVLAGAAALTGCSLLPNDAVCAAARLAARCAAGPRGAAEPARRAFCWCAACGQALGSRCAGLQWLQRDGSVHVDFYEQWAVPPAQAVEDDLRQWLADAGLFRAVVAPGSRLNADFVLEGELDAFMRRSERRRGPGGAGAGPAGSAARARPRCCCSGPRPPRSSLRAASRRRSPRR